MNDFQERLLELLEDNNICRLKLANEINSASTTINDYFNTNNFPHINLAIKIANYFDVSLDYIFGLSDYKENTNRNDKPFFENFEALVKNNNKSILKTMNDMNFQECNYYRWKAGKIPKTNNLLTIAKYFDISLDYLVGNKKD